MHELEFQKAIGAKGWSVLGGMVTLPDKHGRTYRAARVDGKIIWTQEKGPVIRSPFISSQFFYDFDDAATIGCLRQLVRIAWDDLDLYTAPCTVKKKDDPGWMWVVNTRFLPSGKEPFGNGEVGALVEALCAAP